MGFFYLINEKSNPLCFTERIETDQVIRAFGL
jgi:hypothetical protein